MDFVLSSFAVCGRNFPFSAQCHHQEGLKLHLEITPQFGEAFIFWFFATMSLILMLEHRSCLFWWSKTIENCETILSLTDCTRTGELQAIIKMPKQKKTYHEEFILVCLDFFKIGFEIDLIAYSQLRIPPHCQRIPSFPTWTFYRFCDSFRFFPKPCQLQSVLW